MRKISTVQKETLPTYVMIFKRGSERSVTLLCDKVQVNAFGKGRASREHNFLFRFFPFIDNRQAVGSRRQIGKKIDSIFVCDTLAREFPEKHRNSRHGYFPLGRGIIDCDSSRNVANSPQCERALARGRPVSYTHLDVYKRQSITSPNAGG